MAAAETPLNDLDVLSSQVHVEVVKSLDGNPFATVVLDRTETAASGLHPTAVVHVDGEGHELAGRARPSCSTSSSMSDWPPPSPAREGSYGACAVQLKSGDVEMEINEVLAQQGLDGV